MLTTKAIDILNGQLDDLDVEGTSRFDLDDFSKSSKKYRSVMETINILLMHLSKYVLLKITKATVATVEIVYDSIKHLNIYFKKNSQNIEYKILFFLCSQLQSCRLKKLNAGNEERMENVTSTGKIMFQCIKICNDLKINIQNDDNSNPNLLEDIFLKIETELESRNKILLSSQNKATALLLPPHLKSNLNAKQLGILDTIHESIFQDFFNRRKMMLTRVDVTVESFMWGENVIGREGEIVATIQTQRKELSEVPFKYTVDDVFNAPKTLLNEFTRSVSSTGKKNENNNLPKSLVKNMIIGAVPDRGGRVSDGRSTNISSMLNVHRYSNKKPNFHNKHKNNGNSRKKFKS